jgi:hypothetical protein
VDCSTYADFDVLVAKVIELGRELIAENTHA